MVHVQRPVVEVSQVPLALMLFLSGRVPLTGLDYFRGEKSLKWRECAMKNGSSAFLVGKAYFS